MITLRTAEKKDIASISQLAELIWPQTYSEYISETQLRYMLALMYNADELTRQLEMGYVFHIASEDGVDVGFSCVAALDVENQVFKLHKLYILPTMQGKGLGKLMIDNAKKIAKNNGGKLLILNVNKNNVAKDFYARVGFTIQKAEVLEIGNGFVMDDYVMEIKL
ncbi:MAG: GNAT family N-acetyltransferase [Sphingobacteriaceae bacterium]|nr:GNAT family N-acetyltransferase [Sphingobacteriaceae bacterium]